MKTHGFMLGAILGAFMSYQSAVTCAAFDKLHRNFGGHECFRIRPELRPETVGPDQAPFRLHDEDAAGLLRKKLPFWRLHHDVKRAAWH